jgi:hypothetical protein
MPDMTKYPMRGSNKASMKGEAKASGGAGKGFVQSIEKQKSTMHVGSSNGDGVRFPVHAHPDFSDVRSPEK